MRVVKIALPVVLLFLFTLSPAHAEKGLIKVKSSSKVPETAARLESLLREKGMTVFTRVDHSGGAKKAGMELNPTILIIFGNPKVGTPFMQCGQSVAIDLPQKALIWEDEEGQVWFGYNDPRYLAERHGIGGCDEVIQKIERALDSFARGATNP